MKFYIKKYFLLQMIFAIIISSITAFGQYVHPNQAGRKGGDTGPGKGKQVVTSTYFGNAGNLLAQGTIMSVNKDGTNASTFHEFTGYNGLNPSASDGSYPFYTTPHQASDGKLYGSSFIGGSSNWGAVYKYDFGACAESVIYNSSPGSGSPANYANINELSDGKIYSIQTFGGQYYLGGIYSMNKDGSNLTLIHSFSFSALNLVTYTAAAAAQTILPHYDGAHPYGFVVEGADGKIYGSCYDGGSHGRGAFYRCNKNGSDYEIINIGAAGYKNYVNGRNGNIPSALNVAYPWGNVAIDQAGKVYVTGYYGGAIDQGGWARMDPDGSNYQLLHSGSYSDGHYPYRGALIVDNKMYGTTRYGGGSTLSNGVSYGTVFSMNLDGTDHKKLKTFDGLGLPEGAEPWADLSYDGEFLYGTTLVYGGLGKVGTIFKIKPDGNQFQTIHRFSNTAGVTCAGQSKPGMFTYYPSAERVTFADVSVSCSKTCIPNLVCNAGTSNPTLSATTITNDCPATTADLTNVVASNKPANAVLEWHTATPATMGNKVTDAAQVVAGTYYAVFYDASNGCYGNGGAATAAITVNIVTCCPTGKFAPPLLVNKISNACPTTTVNLTTLQIGGSPAGSVITWHTSSTPTAGNKVADPTIASTTGGPYYAAYFNSGSTCYSPATGAVNVTNISCTASARANVCAATTFDLTTVLTGTPPANTVLKWRTAALVEVTDPVHATAGTYYPVYFDATNNCYGSIGSPVTVTINPCAGIGLTNISVSQSASPLDPKSGNAATDLGPSGGTPGYTYSDGSSDPLCVTPPGASPLPGTSNLVVNANGTFTYTAPSVAGTYYFCIKVCDNTSPTPNCTIATYQVVVNPAGCNAGTVAPTLTSTANICSATNVNLNSLVSSTTPVGAVLEWYTNNAHTGTAYATPTSATSGTYYAFYHDITNACFSPTSASITIYVGGVGCSINILANANSVYVDNGVGGGTAGNCLRDGSESSNGLVTGLRVNLILNGAVAYSAAIQVDGSYTLPSVVNGNYTMIIANSATATSVILPNGWALSSGTGLVPVVVSGGNLVTPTTAPSFCLKYCPTITSIISASPTICGLTNGSITLAGLLNGVSYSVLYAKDGGSSSLATIIANASGEIIIPNLGSGVYTGITVSAGGCTTSPATATINDPAGPVISSTLKTDPTSCAGAAAFGNITLQGLTPNTSYTVEYFKDANLMASTGTFTSDGSGNIIIPNLVAGVYSNITVFLNGCESPTVDVTLVGPTPPAAPVLGVSTVSNACPATSVNLIMLSGIPPTGRTHEWHNANNTLAGSLVSTPTAVTTSGTYYVFTKSNASGCFSASGTPVTVTINVCTAVLSAPANTVYNDNGAGGGFTGNCAKDGTESASGLPGGLFINLVQGGLVKFSTALNVDGSYALSGVIDGTYSLVITNSASATASSMPANYSLSSGSGSALITVTNSALASPAALPAFCIRQNPTCDSVNGTISVTPSGGTLGAGMTQKYLLLTTAGVILQESSVPTFVGLPAGNYNVVVIIYDIKPYTIGGNISSVSAGTCIGISPPINFTVCGSSLAAVAGSVYNDNGAGGGIANDCIQNGTEITSPIPSGLFVNLIQSLTVVRSAPFQADGSYIVPGIADGTFDMIITNSATATTSILPATWTVGVASYPVEVSGGSVITPASAPKFCLRQGFPDVVTSLSQPTTALVENAVSMLPVSVVNQGLANATGQLTFTTTLPNSLSASASFTDNGWTCITVLQTVSCTNPNTGDLAPTANRNFNIPITPVIGSAGQTPPIAGTVTPVPNEQITPNNTSLITIATPIAAMPRPDLVTSLGQPSPSLQEGSPSNIPVTITNIGNANATGPLTFTSALPNGYTAPPIFSQNGWTCMTSGQTVSCSNPNTAAIAPLGSTTFDIPITPAVGTAGTTTPISGTVSPVLNENITPNNTASVTPSVAIAPLPRPDLVTTIGQPATPFVEGQPSNIPVTVANIGTAPGTGPLTFTTNLPNGYSAPPIFSQNDWTCLTSGQTVSCSNPNSTGLAPTANTTFNIPITPAVGTAGTILPVSGTTAPVPTETSLPNNANTMMPAAAILPMPRPDLVTTIGQASPALIEGVASNIPVTVTNQGTASGTGTLTFTTTLPTGLTSPATFSNGGWTCSTLGQNVSCTTPNATGLAPAAATTFNIPVTPAIGSVGNSPIITGTVAPVPNETVTPNNTASTQVGPVTIGARPDVVTTMGQPSPVLTEGITSNIPVTLTNQGNAPATGPLTFTTTLPTGLTAPATFGINGWSCSTTIQTVICSNPNVGDLAPTATTTFNIPITPAIGTGGTTPTIVGSVSPVPNETTFPNNIAALTPTAPIAMGARPDLVTTLGQATPSMIEGVASNIPVTIANQGTAPATGILTFTTNLPNGLSAPASFTNGTWACTTSGQMVSCTNPNAAGLAPTALTNFNIPVTPAIGTAGTSPSIVGTVNTVPNENVTPNNTASVTISPAIQVGPRPDVVTTIGQPSPVLQEGISSNIPVTLTNVGNAPATGPLTFSTNLPNGLTAPPTFAQNGWTCITSGQLVSCSNPNTTDLAPVGITTFNIPVTPQGGTAGTTPTIIGSTQPVPNENSLPNNIGIMTPTQAILPAARPDIVASIGQPSPTLTEGITSNIPVTLTNQGNATGNGPLTFTTTLPNSLTAPASFSNGDWTCTTSGQTVSCTSPNSSGLVPTGITTFNIPVTPIAGSAGQTPSVVGTSTPLPNETVVGNNTTTMTPTAPISAMARPDLVTSLGQTTPLLHEGVTSNMPVTITNQGNATATGPLTFTTTLPNGLTSPASFTNGAWTCSTSGQMVSCSNPNLSGIIPLANTAFNIPITPQSGTAGTTPTITGTVAPAPTETVLANNTGILTPTAAILPALKPDLVTTIGQPSPALQEGVTSLIPVTVTSIGTAPATGQLTFTTNLPNGLTAPASFSNGGWTCSTSVQTVNCSTPNSAGLAPTAATTFNIPITPVVGTAGTSPTVSGTVVPVPNETSTPNNTGSMTPTTPIAPMLRPDLVTTIGQISPVLTVGVTSNIPVTITSVGTAPAVGPLTFSMTLPTGLTAPIAFADGTWTCSTSGQTVNCSTLNTAGLVPTAATTFNIPITPAAETAGQTPIISGTTAPLPNETVTANNTGTMIPTTPIQAGTSPDLALSFGTPTQVFTVNIPSIVPVTVTNVGTAPATGQLVVTFNIPNNTTSPLSYSAGNGWTCNASGAILTCANANATGLASTATSTFNIQLTPNANTAGQSVILNGSVAPVGGETVLPNNSSVVVVPLPISGGSVVLSIKAMLQGALVNSTGGLMRDDLRTKNLIPSLQPYTLANGFTQINGGGLETVVANVLTASGNNAIVDWVMVELRNAATPSTVVATRSALIQRDGDIVDIDGFSPVTFNTTAVTWGSQYYVSVRHRNHLGVMTSAPITVTSTTPVIDFTTTSQGNYQFPVGDLKRSSAPQVTQSGLQAMWAGNSTGDNRVIFQGPNNDPDAIFFDVLGDINNTAQIVNFIRNNVYSRSDIDMNGKVIFQGPTNEVDIIFFEVFGHPDNINQIINFIIWQQLP